MQKQKLNSESASRLLENATIRLAIAKKAPAKDLTCVIKNHMRIGLAYAALRLGHPSSDAASTEPGQANKESDDVVAINGPVPPLARGGQVLEPRMAPLRSWSPPLMSATPNASLSRSVLD